MSSARETVSSLVTSVSDQESVGHIKLLELPNVCEPLAVGLPKRVVAANAASWCMGLLSPVRELDHCRWRERDFGRESFSRMGSHSVPRMDCASRSAAVTRFPVEGVMSRGRAPRALPELVQSVSKFTFKL